MCIRDSPGTTALVPAAGAGARFGGPKLWADLSGQPVLAWVLQALGDPASGVDELVVVTHPSEHRRVMELASASAPRLGCRCVEGGARRQESVERGLRLCSREMVLVHDGARPDVYKRQVLFIRLASSKAISITFLTREVGMIC